MNPRTNVLSSTPTPNISDTEGKMTTFAPFRLPPIPIKKSKITPSVSNQKDKVTDSDIFVSNFLSFPILADMRTFSQNLEPEKVCRNREMKELCPPGLFFFFCLTCPNDLQAIRRLLYPHLTYSEHTNNETTDVSLSQKKKEDCPFCETGKLEVDIDHREGEYVYTLRWCPSCDYIDTRYVEE